MRLFDTSHYCNEDTDNYLIEVLPAMKSLWTTFFVQRGFSLTLNSSNLHYKKVNDKADLRELPDGIYEIKQSHKPNIHTVVQFYHLRTCKLCSKVRSEWNKLIGNECKISREEFFKNRDNLREIDEYLMAAKYKVEECLDKKGGKELYDWAEKLLEQYTNECKC